MSRPLRLALLLPLLALGACKESTCSADDVKCNILSIARDWYLWRDELATVNASSISDPAAYLDALTATPRSEGKDRHFSYLTTLAASAVYFEEGQNLGYGFSYDIRGSQLLVAQTFPGSAVAAAGIGRGDELLAIATTTAGLDAAAAQVPAILADAAGANPAALSTALGSGRVSTRAFRVKKLAGATVDLTMTSDLYSLDPVPGFAATPGGRVFNPTILTAGAHTVGYLPLRTFITPAQADLRAAAATLKAAGVTDLIVDLRYNGGGLLSTASVLLDLLGGARARTDVAWDWRFNSGHTGDFTPVLFGAEASALAPQRVAFILRGGSASASELVVNALQPYLARAGAAPDLALIGARSYGKPVGQRGFNREGSEWLLMLISFQVVNAEGTGDYFQGLPDGNFRGDSCLADDDLAHAQGDAAEASTAAALNWINGGACAGGAIPVASSSLLAQRRQAREAFEASAPTLGQRQIPGLY